MRLDSPNRGPHSDICQTVDAMPGNGNQGHSPLVSVAVTGGGSYKACGDRRARSVTTHFTR